MPHESFLTRRQATKVRNVFANKVSIDMKGTKAQICKAIQWSRYFLSWLVNLGKKELTNVAVPLAKENLPGLGSNLTLNGRKIFQRK